MATEEGGNVTTANFEFNMEGKTITKVAAWGTVPALVAHRRIHLLWAEVGADGLPKETETVLEKFKDCHLLLIGVEDGMFRALGQLNKLKESHAVLWQYKTAMIHLHLKEDPPLGPKVSPAVNVTRNVLLASPHPLKTHRNYIALDYTWRCSILMHLVNLFDIPQKSVFTTLLYLPHSVRPSPDVLSKMGHVLAQMDRWQVSFVLPEETGALDVTAQLQSIVVTAHSQAAQAEYERTVLCRGMTLNSFNLLQPVKREGGGPATPAKATQEEGAQSSRREDNVVPDDQNITPTKDGSASAGGVRGKGFKPPRKVGEGHGKGTALGERQARGKTRLTAEALEANAEEQAERAAKKARQANTTGNVGKGKRGSKAKGASTGGGVDLSDFPEGEL